jgi:D-alanyl-D-alanine endopeptidase (penicillin-binding protein 7)
LLAVLVLGLALAVLPDAALAAKARAKAKSVWPHAGGQGTSQGRGPRPRPAGGQGFWQTCASPRGRQGRATRALVRRTFSGLRATDDELDLKSSVALVVDQDTDEVLFSKNPSAVLPIASITKLMTALVVTEAQLSLEEPLTVTQDDVAATAGSRSRLALGTQLTRGEMLHLALMASENRAAHLLGRTYPGGWSRLSRR